MNEKFSCFVLTPAEKFESKVFKTYNPRSIWIQPALCERVLLTNINKYHWTEDCKPGTELGFGAALLFL